MKVSIAVNFLGTFSMAAGPDASAKAKAAIEASGGTVEILK